MPTTSTNASFSVALSSDPTPDARALPAQGGSAHVQRLVGLLNVVLAASTRQHLERTCLTPIASLVGADRARLVEGDAHSDVAPGVLRLPLQDVGPVPAMLELEFTGGGPAPERRLLAESIANLLALRLSDLEQRERLSRSALDATLDPVTIVSPVRDAGGRVIDFEMQWCNQAHLAGGGSPPGALMVDLADTMVSIDVVEAHRRVYESGEPMVIDDIRVLAPDGTGEVVETFVDVGISKFGDGVLTSYRPASDRVLAQRELTESERLFRSAFDEAPLGMVLFSLDESCIGECLRVNAAYQELTGFTEEELREGGWQLIVPDEDVEHVASLIASMAAGRVHRHRAEGRTRTAAGTLIATQVDFSVVLRNDRPTYGVAHVEDVTERRRAESELSWSAMHDSLTGLPNRHLFAAHLQFALTRLERRPGTLAMLHIRLDEGVEPDATNGQGARDVVLTEAARRIAATIRRSDTPARIGAHDFAVLLPDVAGSDGARILAERIVQVMGEPLADWRPEVLLTSSVGVALTRDASSTPEALMETADRAMRSARPPTGDRIAVSSI